MRTIKELFELLLSKEETFHGSICLWALRLSTLGVITHPEYCSIRDYVANNKPSIFYDWERFKHSVIHKGKALYWERDLKEPRMKWIKKQLKKYEK
jgi:hypothetical protein